MLRILLDSDVCFDLAPSLATSSLVDPKNHKLVFQSQVKFRKNSGRCASVFHRLTMSAQVTAGSLPTGLLMFDTAGAVLRPFNPHTGKAAKARGEPPVAISSFNTSCEVQPTKTRRCTSPVKKTGAVTAPQGLLARRSNAPAARRNGIAWTARVWRNV